MHASGKARRRLTSDQRELLDAATAMLLEEGAQPSSASLAARLGWDETRVKVVGVELQRLGMLARVAPT